METFNCIKVSENFECKYCDYKTCVKSNFNKHCLTSKHKNNCNGNALETKELSKSILNTNYYCKLCNQYYNTRSGLWKHKQKCDKKEENTQLVLVETKSKSIIDHEIVFDFVKQMTENNELLIKHQIEKEAENNKITQEFQKQSLENQMQMFQQMMEFMKQQCAITNNNINNGQIQNNTHFNLQVYLNETCKNAMTINQFLDYLQPTVEELEATAYLGYVEGISRIIMRGFKNLEEEELPFHCTDLKREHIYVKNPDDEWVEEKDEKPLLLRFIKEVAKKSFNNLSAWQKKNPNWSNYHSKQNDMFMKILNNSVSGETEEEQQANYEKIMKNIMKNTVIDKSKKNKK